MKFSLLHLAVLASVLLLSGCMFEQPVFTSGFSTLPASMAGVWTTASADVDPRQVEYAVLVPFEGEKWLLDYPASSGGSTYYEVLARPPGEAGQILQLRTLATFERGASKAGEKNYTLVLLRQTSPGELEVRVIGKHSPLQDQTAEQAAQMMEAPGADWSAMFDGDVVKFRLLKPE